MQERVNHPPTRGQCCIAPSWSVFIYNETSIVFLSSTLKGCGSFKLSRLLQYKIVVELVGGLGTAYCGKVFRL
jgi:hypothetical protein